MIPTTNGRSSLTAGDGRSTFSAGAPGCSANHTTGGVRDGYSDIQSGDPTQDHDPFDPFWCDYIASDLTHSAYHLIPLIYSDGATPGDSAHGISVGGKTTGTPYSFAGTGGNIFGSDDFLHIGSLVGITSYGGITNHHVEHAVICDTSIPTRRLYAR